MYGERNWTEENGLVQGGVLGRGRGIDVDVVRISESGQFVGSSLALDHSPYHDLFVSFS
jgi:hypothetical protein